MLDFFDFIFYRTYKKYIQWGESEIPGVYALCLITLFPGLNISSLFFWGIDCFQVTSWEYNAGVILIFFLLTLLLNYFRIYKKIGLEILIRRWDEESELRKRKLSICMYIYLIASIILLFVSIK